jgi:hypothetical protein
MEEEEEEEEEDENPFERIIWPLFPPALPKDGDHYQPPLKKDANILKHNILQHTFIAAMKLHPHVPHNFISGMRSHPLGLTISFQE